jgi:hypothetical protein
MNEKIQFLRDLGCKNPESTLAYIQDPKSDPVEKGMKCSHNNVWEHVVSFIEETGEEGDDAVFFALNSCDNFSLFLDLLEETENGFILYDEEGKANFKWNRNKKGYLYTK